MAWRMHGIFESWLKDLVRSELWDTWKVIPKTPKTLALFQHCWLGSGGVF